MAQTDKHLIIIPCVKSKIWDRISDARPTAAKDAYYGGYFEGNREYAMRFGVPWFVFSAKYGLLAPDDLIENYNRTFKLPVPDCVTVPTIKSQIARRGLGRFPFCIGLGGAHYLSRLRAAFDGTGVRLIFPFKGLPIGKAMHAVREAIRHNDPFFNPYRQEME